MSSLHYLWVCIVSDIFHSCAVTVMKLVSSTFFIILEGGAMAAPSSVFYGVSHNLQTRENENMLCTLLLSWLCHSSAASHRVRSCGICGGQSLTGAGFLRVRRLPLPIFHSTNCSTITIIYHVDWYNRPVVATVPSGLNLTLLRIVRNK
jgi:hypothetical protein